MKMKKLKNEEFIDNILSFIKENQKNKKGYNNKNKIKIQKEIHLMKKYQLQKKVEKKIMNLFITIIYYFQKKKSQDLIL